MTANNKFYISTPIYYANDVPHIGHTGTTVFADIVGRYYRLKGVEVFSLTGTDEHGEKVAESANKNGKEPQEFVDELSEKWKQYWSELNISNDYFIRTTSEGHIKVVNGLLAKLYEKDAIYKDEYEGIYCVGCEEFKAEKDLVDGKCPEHRPDQIQKRKEENYFFKITDYLPKVKELIKSGELAVEPENKKAEMLARLDENIHDLSISRPNVPWGIPIPWDKTHTTYVWFEALMNYYSAPQIVNKPELWPADVHFLGKGINWFHSVVWPAMLLALELPLPKRVFVHAYYNVEGQKMGKSLGNVISPQNLIDRYGVDGTRYLLAASMPYSNDSDVSFGWFDKKYNADLANGIGNLAARISKLAEGQSIIEGDADFTAVFDKHDEISKLYEDFKLHEVVGKINKLVGSINEYLNANEPWKKTGEERESVVKKAALDLLEIVVLISPIIPDASDKVIRALNGDVVEPVGVLFNKI